MAGILSLTISQLENLSILDEYLAKLGKLHSRVLNIEEAHFKLMGKHLFKLFKKDLDQNSLKNWKIYGSNYIYILLILYYKLGLIQY